MLYRKMKEKEVYRIINDEETKIIGAFGTVRALSEKGILYLDGHEPNDKYVVLIIGDDRSSREFETVAECKQYIEKRFAS